MSEISAYEAKTHFSQILARAEKGERLTITKHGRAVAHLIPAGRDHGRSLGEIGRRLAELRKGCRLDGITLKDLISEGRR